ncbi:hypothetical protein J4573_40555 [Actinomadura barringtoniae]|uniref:Transmembrane protein n=1 Tax=Actinomadura barringtoniae TaxID=1427535 RepID=A0A939T581_9ACTN|nr:hypothetical protein [Actinomadura barringtoniae]MBO2453441.1 hypothetical protein [Actinomadura barringtoniae]
MHVHRARRGYGRWNRLRRGLGFSRSELWRGVDRVQQVAALILVALYVATAAVVTAQACERVYASGVQSEKVQAATRHRVAGGDYRTWLDSQGHPTDPPQTRSDTVADTVMAGSFVALLVCVPFLSAYGLVRRRLDVRRERAWDREWKRLDRRPTP